MSLLESTNARQLADATSAAQVHRATLSVTIEALEQIDDSFGELGELFREQKCAYLELLDPDFDAPAALRDLLELAVCEDYGLFRAAHRGIAPRRPREPAREGSRT